MWDIVTSIGQWPMWNFFSVVLVVYITQLVIASRERRKKISETQLELYMNTIAPLCDLYETALNPKATIDKANLHRNIFEIAARYSIMGSDQVMETFCKYSEFVMQHVQKECPANERELRKLATDVTCAMCCDIHNETYSESSR